MQAAENFRDAASSFSWLAVIKRTSKVTYCCHANSSYDRKISCHFPMACSVGGR